MRSKFQTQQSHGNFYFWKSIKAIFGDLVWLMQQWNGRQREGGSINKAKASRSNGCLFEQLNKSGFLNVEVLVKVMEFDWDKHRP